jgi:hypothetical protein
MDINNFLQSKGFKITASIIGCFAVLLLVFGLGMFVGEKKANFSFRWAEQYHRNFAGPAGGFFQEFTRPGEEFLESNGTIGEIIQISDKQITIKGRNDIERVVNVGDNTTIKYQNQNMAVSNLKTGDNVVIIGNPNGDGQLEAVLIRVMPTPETDIRIINPNNDK